MSILITVRKKGTVLKTKFKDIPSTSTGKVVKITTKSNQYIEEFPFLNPKEPQKVSWIITL